MPKVNPDILRWARETAGLSPEAAVKKLSLLPARGASAIERLAALESGDDLPSRPMLVKMSKQYRRPLLTFYLSEPPQRGDRGQDFRKLPKGQSLANDPLLDALIRDVLARQSMVRSAMEDEEDISPLPYVGSKRMSDGNANVLASIQSVLQISLDDFRSQSSPREAFAALRRTAEEAGIFVLLIGNLGTHHTTIELKAFRGFALADEVAPFVVINDQDSDAAWSFTLLHELTHIWLGQTGISGARAERAIERFCSDVASEFLLPRDELEQFDLADSTNIQDTVNWISQFGAHRKLSGSLVAYRLYRAGSIDKETWQNLDTVFTKMWLATRDDQRQKSRNQEGGPNYYIVRRYRVGGALLDLVDRLVAAGDLTTSKAGKVLGVKAKQVQTLLEARHHTGVHRPA